MRIALALSFVCLSGCQSAPKEPPQEYFSYQKSEQGVVQFAYVIESGAKVSKRGRGGRKEKGRSPQSAHEPSKEDKSDVRGDEQSTIDPLLTRLERQLELRQLCLDGYFVTQTQRQQGSIQITGECR